MPEGWPRAVLLLLLTSYAISTTIGLCSSLNATTHSDNPFLRSDNALRLAKALAETIALLPFIRHRQRTRGDAAIWWGWGMVAGLAAVTIEVLAERLLFTGLLDFSSDYRVAGPFSSMRVGGGHIGAYVAMTLPFILVIGRSRVGLWAGALSLLAALGGGYTLAVTYARAAYAAGLAAISIAALFWLIPRWRRDGKPALAIVPIMLVLVALCAALCAVGSSAVMRNRFGNVAIDLITRESNWRAGWAVRDPSALTAAFGMGLGTYQRTMLARASTNRPSDFSLEGDDGGAYVALRIETPFYLGQKIALPADGDVHLTLRIRAHDAVARLGVSLCDKVLLYSDNCRGPLIQPAIPGRWEAISTTMSVQDLGRPALGGLLHRPVELSLFDPVTGSRLDLREVRLTDAVGRSLLANGDFSHGMDRWIFTDDSHVSWRILNQYLMLLFETGAFGLLAMLAFCGLAIGGGMRAAWSGDPMGAAVAAAIVAFLVSGLFDNVLEAPRLATLVLLTCGMGLLLWETKVGVDPAGQ